VLFRSEEAPPILNVPSAYKVVEGAYGEDFEFTEEDAEVQGYAVYGNHVTVGTVAGRYADTWAEIFDPEDGSSLGFIEKSGLEPLPEYKAFRKSPNFTSSLMTTRTCRFSRARAKPRKNT
jgi:hypothetical protein